MPLNCQKLERERETILLIRIYTLLLRAIVMSSDNLENKKGVRGTPGGRMRGTRERCRETILPIEIKTHNVRRSYFPLLGQLTPCLGVY